MLKMEVPPMEVARVPSSGFGGRFLFLLMDCTVAFGAKIHGGGATKQVAVIGTESVTLGAWISVLPPWVVHGFVLWLFSFFLFEETKMCA